MTDRIKPLVEPEVTLVEHELLPSTVEGGYSFDKVQALIESRLHLLPPFHRRLVRVPFDLHHPVWVEDPDFDIIHHVRRISCPAPGGLRGGNIAPLPPF